MTILVVEDSASTRFLLSSIVEDIGLDCVLVGSGEEALEFISGDVALPEVTILDIGLPGIDGYETCLRMKALSGASHLPVIFLTSAKDNNILSKCLEVGDDYVAKPFTEEMITSKIEAHRRVSDVYRQLESQYQELQRFQYSTNLEHKIVENIFSKQFEKHISVSDNFRYHLSPKSVFNGDVLLTAYGPSGSLYIAIGDVTGHGLPAAVAAIPVYPTFRSMAVKGIGVGSIAAQMNAALLGILPDNMMVAASLLELSKAGDTLTVWSGGMPPMILADDMGNIKQLISPSHCPLGMLETHKFAQDIQVFNVNRGDKIYLFTDGVEESRNSNNEMFGEARLHGLFDGNDGDMFSRIIDQHKKFTGIQEQDDDISLVEVCCGAHLGPVAAAEDAGENIRIMPWTLSYDLDAEDMQAANPVHQIIEQLSNASGLDVHQDYLSTILSELFSNALEHGVLELDSSIKETDDGFLEYYQLRREKLENLTDGFIHIKIQLKKNADNPVIEIKVKDSGKGRVDQKATSPDMDKAFGRGIDIVRTLCDSVVYDDIGSGITVTYSLQTIA